MMQTIQLKTKRDGSVRRFHPWIFSGAIATPTDELSDGELVKVLAANGDTLGIGHFQYGSISVRILSFGAAGLDQGFWANRLQSALQLRKQLNLVSNGATNAYRLVHGEGDGLPGLIIDIYGTAAVIQCHSIGMHREIEKIANSLQQLYEGALTAIYDKSRESLPARYADGIQPGFLLGDKGADIISENGYQFKVNWESGQKTGFFLDQRDNRQLLTHFSAGKKLLNAFCYTGGFSVYALGAGASQVDSVDLSEKAVNLTKENIIINQATSSHQAIRADVLEYLKTVTDPYDLAVVDPPAYAKRPSKRHKAVQGYKRLNALAMSKLKPGGLLFTFSCSEVVDRSLFNNTIVAAAIEAGRRARILQEMSQGSDHPISLHHPEGSYLKGLVLQLDD